MKSKLLFVAAFSALIALSGCGGGGSSSTPAKATSVPLTLLGKADTVVGTGATAAVGNTISVFYTLWLYDSTAAGSKGTMIETNVGGTVATFPLASGSLIEGWVQGIPGMKVGGKRTLLVPASLGYGAAGAPPKIPSNADLVFEVELVGVK
jgi:FKBP-type peptidyl-prolyl cis-trans isomerase FkpA